MGRVEETNKVLGDLQKTVKEAICSTTDKSIVIAHVLTLQAGTNEEIAKSLAQLADDIHFLREILAKEAES